MAFHFRLEKMLHFLRLKETMKKMEIVSIQKRITFLARRKEQLERNARELLGAPEMTFYHTTKIAWDSKEAGQLEKNIVEENRSLEKRKGELKRLMQRKKGLEALRETKEHDYRTDEMRKDQKRVDDIYSSRRERGH